MPAIEQPLRCAAHPDQAAAGFASSPAHDDLYGVPAWFLYCTDDLDRFRSHPDDYRLVPVPAIPFEEVGGGDFA
jgi:hypothetical protein